MESILVYCYDLTTAPLKIQIKIKFVFPSRVVQSSFRYSTFPSGACKTNKMYLNILMTIADRIPGDPCDLGPDVSTLGSHLVSQCLGHVGPLLGFLQVVLSLPESADVDVALLLLQMNQSVGDVGVSRKVTGQLHSRLLQPDACRPSSCSGACPPSPAAGRCSSCLPQTRG